MVLQLFLGFSFLDYPSKLERDFLVYTVCDLNLSIYHYKTDFDTNYDTFVVV